MRMDIKNHRTVVEVEDGMPVDREKFNEDVRFWSVCVQLVFTGLGWVWGEYTKPYQQYQHWLWMDILCSIAIGVCFTILYLSFKGVIIDKIDMESGKYEEN